jgi:SurA-like N-terminal domain
LPGGVRAETLDRVVASIGHAAITQHDLEEEYHFERFIQGQAPEGSPDPSVRKAVLSRLISQKLLAEQLRSTNLETRASQENAEKTLNEVRKEFSSEQAYRSALQKLAMTEPQVIKRLVLYQRTLRMIDARLRSTSMPDPKEVETYYKETFVPEYAKGHSTPPPPLNKVHDEIQEILVQRKMNQLLSNWLDRLKSSRRVTIHSN